VEEPLVRNDEEGIKETLYPTNQFERANNTEAGLSEATTGDLVASVGSFEEGL
jgi:hypothetical protein